MYLGVWLQAENVFHPGRSLAAGWSRMLFKRWGRVLQHIWERLTEPQANNCNHTGQEKMLCFIVDNKQNDIGGD